MQCVVNVWNFDFERTIPLNILATYYSHLCLKLSGLLHHLVTSVVHISKGAAAPGLHVYVMPSMHLLQLRGTTEIQPLLSNQEGFINCSPGHIHELLTLFCLRLVLSRKSNPSVTVRCICPLVFVSEYLLAWILTSSGGWLYRKGR